MSKLTLDQNGTIYFYEQDHYYLSNFSSFSLRWRMIRFDTSEVAYHWEKFRLTLAADDEQAQNIRNAILLSASSHEAFKIAEKNRHLVRPDWDLVKVGRMREILRAKVDQHEYVRRKLLETGGARLVENSWRDDYWGWGPNRDGRNVLGELWMEIREELRRA